MISKDRVPDVRIPVFLGLRRLEIIIFSIKKKKYINDSRIQASGCPDSGYRWLGDPDS